MDLKKKERKPSPPFFRRRKPSPSIARPPFVFCGAVHAARPSAVLPLPWPDPAEDAAAAGLQVALPEAAFAKISVSVGDLAALPPVLDADALRRAERLALRVGESRFNFMQSFCGVDGRYFGSVVQEISGEGQEGPELSQGFRIVRRAGPERSMYPHSLF
ncbi:uncharacterized protein LOC103705867 [Phoenix dactylifera]|uniref:Uncharacterized protein LOC103705867 n=1 Tax=Phoenix dactylifera TaxID=42345 RepID=A0A8B9AUD8_PHODC|nr:uncharacterized protein LOC103705867 [Phoenix dactylifera]